MTRNKYDDNTTAWAARFNADVNAHDSEAVLNGCSPSKGTNNWDVDVASGDITLGSGSVSVSAQTENLNDPTSDMSSGEERLVIVTINSSGNTNHVEGTATGSNPTSPDIPTDEVLVATVHVENGDASLADSDLFDDRVLTATRTDALTWGGY